MVEEFAAADMATADDLRSFAALCRPAVIRQGFSDWPAVAAGRQSAASALSHIARFAAGLSAEYFTAGAALGGRYHYGAGPGGYNFGRETASVGDALGRIAANAESGAETAYLGSLPADAYFPGFAEENPCGLVSAGVHPRLWIGNRSTIACHYDAYDNLACVVAGRRRFTLYPPDAIGDLYVGPVDHTLSGQPVSMAAGKAVISTDTGMQGIEAAAGTHYLRANTPAEFAAAVAWCMRHEDDVLRMRQAAADLMARKYDAGSIMKGILSQLKTLRSVSA